MASSKVFEKDSSGAVDFNMTPMIDVTFQLIIFFILAGQMASQELAPVKLHEPVESQAIPEEKMQKEGRVIINIVSDADEDPEAPPNAYRDRRAKEFRIGQTSFVAVNESFTKELERIKNMAVARSGKEAKEIYVEIRGDYRVSFAQVKMAMIAAAEAGFEKMNLTALVKKN